MIISLCIVCMNRTDDLRQTLPATIKAANASPPVEIVILNYDSKDDLENYIQEVKMTEHFENGNTLKYVKSLNHEYFKIAHSRNIAALSAAGEYIVIQDADIIPHEDTIQTWRSLIDKYNPVWMIEEGRYIDHVHVGGRLLVCKKDEFVAMGGYDERFYLCGPEDKDICMRLHRRGGRFATFSRYLVDEIRTDQKKKIANLEKAPFEQRLTEEQRVHKTGNTKYMMQLAMRQIYLENCKNGVLVANEGKTWGQG